MKPLACPDCAAVTTASTLRHHPGCPIGDGYDRIQTDDRAFFNRYPLTDVRRRKPYLAELFDYLLVTGATLPPNRLGKAWAPAGYVLVFRTENPDVRLKDYANAYLIEDPDQPVTDWLEFPPAPDLGDPCELCAELMETPDAIARGICDSCQRALAPPRPNKRRKHA